jgi:hypothetical protein
LELRVALLLFTFLEFLLCTEEVNMRGRHTAWVIQMDEQSRATLQRWLRQQKTPLGLAKQVALTERNLRKWVKRFCEQGLAELSEQPRPGRLAVFSPEVALHVVKLACERPDQVGRSLSKVGIAPNWHAN